MGSEQRWAWGLAFLFTQGCSGGPRSESTATATSALLIRGASQGADIADFSHPISVNVPANTLCTVYPEGVSDDASRTDQILAGDDGVLRFYAPPKTWGTRLVFECESRDSSQLSRQTVDLNDPSTFFLEPSLLATTPPKVVGTRPALSHSDLLGISPADLFARRYPLRPDPTTMPKQYATWVARVTRPFDVLAPAPLIHGLGWAGHGYDVDPPMPWCGQVLNPNRSTGVQYTSYAVDIVVPTTSCSAPCTTDIWGGVGGYGDPGNALIQSGFWITGGWSGGNSQNLFLNIEYANNGWTQVHWNALNFSPGDVILAEGWPCSSASSGPCPTCKLGCYWFEDDNTGQTTSTMTQPIPTAATLCGGVKNGCFYTGNTAEWIVEKPNGNALADFGSNEELYGLAFDSSGTGHDDETDPFAFWDLHDSSGNTLMTTFMVGNSGGSDTPPQPQLGFSWWNSQ